MLGRDDPRAHWHVVAVGAVTVAGYLLAPTGSLIQVSLWFVPLVLAVALIALRRRDSPPGPRRPLGWLLAAALCYLGASLA